MAKSKEDKTTEDVADTATDALENLDTGVEDPQGTPKPALEKAPAVAGAEQVQEAVDAQHEQGFRGVAADPTPNEHYSVAGVIAGKPTPETDEDHAEWVRQEQRKAQKGRL